MLGFARRALLKAGIIKEVEDIEFKSWAAASKRSKGLYDDELLSRFRADRAALRGSDVASYAPSELVQNVLASVGEGEFVDFGGATGEKCLGVLAEFPRFRCTVVEVASVVDRATNLALPIIFRTDMPSSFDIFHTSGALQYLEDPMSMLAKGLGRSKKYAVLVRNAFSDKRKFHVQKSRLFDNGTGPIPPGYQNLDVFYPHQTLVEKNVVAAAERAGFDLVSRQEDISGLIGVEHMYGADLVFKRR